MELLLSSIFCNKVSIGVHNGIQPADVALCRLLDTLKECWWHWDQTAILPGHRGGENFVHGPGRKARFCWERRSARYYLERAFKHV